MNEASYRRLDAVPFFSQHRVDRDLARFSLDLNLANAGGGGVAREAFYPSPPMSGSPPPSRPPRSSDQGDDYSSILSRPDASEVSRQRTQPPSSQPSQSSPVQPPDIVASELQSLREPEPERQLPSIFAAAQPSQLSRRPALTLPALTDESSQHAPYRPRSTKSQKLIKSHTPSACQHCRHKHLKCETTRPCSRCVQKGLQDTCIDQQHKKRGRPRLREESQVTAVSSVEGYRPEQSQRPTHASPLASPFEHHHRIPSSATTTFGPSRTNSITSLPPLSSANTAPSIYQPFDLLPTRSPPVAFLTLGLFIVKSSQSFLSMLGLKANEIEGRDLSEVVATQDMYKVNAIGSRLSLERDRRQPTGAASASSTDAHSKRVISAVPEQDHIAVTQGFERKIEELSFRLRENRPCRIQISLARTSLYFVVLTLQTPDVETSPRHQAASFPPRGPTTPFPHVPTTSPIFSPLPPETRQRLPASGSSAPASPYFSVPYPGPGPMRYDPVLHRSPQPDPPFTFPSSVHQYQNIAPAPLSALTGRPQHVPTPPSPATRMTRRRESAPSPRVMLQQPSVFDRPQGLDDLQLPPIREQPSGPATRPSAGLVRRRSDYESDPRTNAEPDQEDQTRGQGRRKRARIDVKEVVD